MKKIIHFFLLILLGLGHRVYSDTFIESYGSSTLTNVTVSPVSHTFKVDTPWLITKHTEWYLTYSGGSPEETDSSSISDPSYTRSFSVGTYWVRAEVHDSNWNWQEVHRWEVTVTTGSSQKSDLNSFILLPPSTYEPGDTLSGTVKVSNFGDATSNSGYVDVFLHRSSPSYSSIDRIDHEFYAPISVGGTDSSSFSYRIPVNTTPGTYYLTCKADVTNTSDESNENNNTYQKTITISAASPPPDGPDLIVQDIWTDPSPVIEGQSFVIKARIKNQGNITAESTTGRPDAKFYINGAVVGVDDHGTLASNETVVVQTGTLSGRSAANYTIWVDADVNDDITESLEGNNTRTESLRIEEITFPDLIVQSISVAPGHAWRPSTITAVIRNRGSVEARFGFLDRICRFSVDGQVKYDTRLLSLTIPPSGTYSATESFTVSGEGSYSVMVKVDPDNDVDETLDNNNTLTQSKTWVASSSHDTDGDGMIDADEVIAGSQPDNGSNVWECAMVSTNAEFMITWPSISNRWYNVERTYNLTNDFVVIVTNLPATPPKNSYWDETTSNAFYRIEVRK